MPNLLASISRPSARVKSPLPSASITTLPPAPWLSPQAPITKASLTDRQAMVSTPLAWIAAAFWMKPGRCLAEQVGVNAPGSAKRTTFLPSKSSDVVIGFGPPSFICINVADGILSPTLIVMFAPFWGTLAGAGCSPAFRLRQRNVRVGHGGERPYSASGRRLPSRQAPGRASRHARSALRQERDLHVHPHREGRDGHHRQQAVRRPDLPRGRRQARRRGHARH